jgi:molecular chaperone HtpG
MIAEEVRNDYPIHVSVQTVEVYNELSEAVEQRDAVVVDDIGTGMDQNTIERYLLQIGKSFYTTDEFRRNFPFRPVSRFGIGFLSVFGVSDNVTIDTYSHRSGSAGKGIRLKLAGPRGYLLTEYSDRRTPGTRITVVLRDHLEPGAVQAAVRYWCRKVEFPIVVDESGETHTIRPETPDALTYEIHLPTDESTRLAVRAFPSDIPGVEGEFYVFARVAGNDERWDAWGWAQVTYPNTHPLAEKPDIPETIICVGGILVDNSMSRAYSAHGTSTRLDYRDGRYSTTLARTVRHERRGFAFRRAAERNNSVNPAERDRSAMDRTSARTSS